MRGESSEERFGKRAGGEVQAACSTRRHIVLWLFARCSRTPGKARLSVPGRMGEKIVLGTSG